MVITYTEREQNPELQQLIGLSCIEHRRLSDSVSTMPKERRLSPDRWVGLKPQNFRYVLVRANNASRARIQKRSLGARLQSQRRFPTLKPHQRVMLEKIWWRYNNPWQINRRCQREFERLHIWQDFHFLRWRYFNNHLSAHSRGRRGTRAGNPHSQRLQTDRWQD